MWFIILLALFTSGCGNQTAGWYGVTGDTTDPWKHVWTASGERFNEEAMTAASRKYPIGALVMVTNQRNVASVVVRINDIGPGWHLYRRGRVMDLSRGAFARIADLNTGIIKITTRRIQ